MRHEYTMPKLGHLMEEGFVSEWKKKVGERIEKNEILLLVETDKAVVEVEAPFSGKIQEIIVQEGEEVPVHALLAIIDIDE